MKKSVEIPYARQWIDEGDIQAVNDVLRSDRLTQGPIIVAFEKALAKYCGARYAVAVNSGTSALHIAALAASVGDGDEVITSPITFVASANCAVYCRAKPVFADIDKTTYNIDPLEIKKRMTEKTRAIIPVHFAGQSCDTELLFKIVSEHEKKHRSKIYTIEDACHALGSFYNGQMVGSCTYSDMTVMSFHPVKHITTGEGGAVLTNDESLYEKLIRYRSHGITYDPEDFINRDLAFPSNSTGSSKSHISNPWYYEQQELGYNYRITDIQCALGLAQLGKLGMFTKRRREIVNMYNDAFSNVKHVQIPFESAKCNSNFHLYALLFDFKSIGIDRCAFILELRKRGVHTQVHYIPVHLQPFYQKNFGTKWGDYPNAENYYKKCLSIPLYPELSNFDVQKVLNEITSILER